MRHPVTLSRQLPGRVIFTNPGVAPVPLRILASGQSNVGNGGPLGWP